MIRCGGIGILKVLNTKLFSKDIAEKSSSGFFHLDKSKIGKTRKGKVVDYLLITIFLAMTFVLLLRV